MKKWMLMIALWAAGLQGFSQNLYPMMKKGKWGYMDGEGKMVIGYKYDLAQPFHDGYASVALGNMPCLIDVNENRIIDTGLYQFIGTFSEGLVPVMDYKYLNHYINAAGEKVLSLPKEVYEARSFYNGVARVGKKFDIVQNKFGFDITNLGYKFAYINASGKLITDYIFDDGDDMDELPARFMQGTRYGLIDSSGKIIKEASYEFIGNFNEGLAVVNKMGKFGYINTRGDLVKEAKYDFARPFCEGLAAVEVAGKIGFIDTSGTLVIPAQFEDVKPFSEGRAGVLLEGKWGMIDPKGNFVYRPTFEDMGYFNEGICPVRMKGKWGALDKEGHILVPFEFEFIGIFEDGIAEVIYKSLNFYVNRRGEILPK